MSYPPVAFLLPTLTVIITENYEWNYENSPETAEQGPRKVRIIVDMSGEHGMASTPNSNKLNKFTNLTT